jgi:hypothetical protein
MVVLNNYFDQLEFAKSTIEMSAPRYFAAVVSEPSPHFISTGDCGVVRALDVFGAVSKKSTAAVLKLAIERSHAMIILGRMT